jgi:glycerol kinase
VPRSLLPRVLDSAADFGRSEPALFGDAIAIGGIAGDQQAATVGQACFQPGMAKSTYGTGCFIVLNTGAELKLSRNRLLSTVAYRLAGKPTFALEGSIFIAGAAVQWLRDSLHLIKSAGETEPLARSIEDSRGVYLVPAFTGLGAPYWDPQARGALFGLTRDTGIAQLVRAGLEAMGYQTRDLMQAMAQDAVVPTELRVDGGMVVNDWLSQNLADMLQLPVVRPQTVESTPVAGGATLLATDAGSPRRRVVRGLARRGAPRAQRLLKSGETVLAPRLVNHHRHGV